MSTLKVDNITDAAGTGPVQLEGNEFKYIPWTDYTPSTTGLGTISNVFVQYRQVGDSLEIRGRLQAGTLVDVEVQIGLPAGYTIGGPTGQTIIVGRISRDNNTTLYSLRGKQGETFLTISTTANDAEAGATSFALFGDNAVVQPLALAIPVV